MTRMIEFKDDDLLMLRAVLTCAATRDVRYYLNGIHVTEDYVEGTDGHRIARFAVPIRYEELDVIVPKFKIRAATNTLVIAIDGRAVEVREMDRNGSETVQKLSAIDGKFPDTYRVIPDAKATGTTSLVQLDPRLISDVLAACRAPKHVGVNIHVTGGEGQVYRIGVRRLPELLFCLMPNMVRE